MEFESVQGLREVISTIIEHHPEPRRTWPDVEKYQLTWPHQVLTCSNRFNESTEELDKANMKPRIWKESTKIYYIIKKKTIYQKLCVHFFQALCDPAYDVLSTARFVGQHSCSSGRARQGRVLAGRSLPADKSEGDKMTQGVTFTSNYCDKDIFVDVNLVLIFPFVKWKLVSRTCWPNIVFLSCLQVFSRTAYSRMVAFLWSTKWNRLHYVRPIINIYQPFGFLTPALKTHQPKQPITSNLGKAKGGSFQKRGSL